MRLFISRASSVLCAALLLPPVAAHAQAASPAGRFIDSARVWIEAAETRATALDSVTTYLDRALTVVADDPRLMHYRGYAEYRLVIAQLVSGAALGSLSGRLERADDWLQRSASLRWPETPALRASIFGLMIAADPSRGAELAARIGEMWGEASALGAQNPRVLLLQARSAQNTPPEYGGGIELARSLARRSLAAFAVDKPAPFAPSWGAAEARQLLTELGTP